MDKTYSPKPDEIERKWWIVDAADQTLGRLASKIALILRGKHKPIYAPHLDVGDYVIVINAEKIHTTGNRMEDKIYHRHSKYQGGLKSIRLKDQIDRFPDRPIKIAVKGMLPKNALGRQMFKKLKVYAGPNHPHEAQQPEVLKL
jgi:large subunit ribosomal protein L13